MILHTDADYKGLRESGRILADVLVAVQDEVRSGVTTVELNAIAEERVLAMNARPAFKGYDGFPAGLCISVNEEVVHGVPGDRILKDGDVVGVDFGVDYKGYFTDAAVTVVVGKSSDENVERLIATAKKALDSGIAVAIPGNMTGDVGHAIQKVVESEGFGLIRELVGHGVGADVHEDPSVPNYGEPERGVALELGMVLAIEPMITLGGKNVERDSDGQAYKTSDNSIAAHVEHTIIVGIPPEVVTLL